VIGIRRSSLAVTLAAVAVALPSAAPAGPASRCFGAPARDPHHPCASTGARYRVTPSPDDALLMPDAPCDPVGDSTEWCTFGTPPDEATGTIALFGDSHARHYRATVQAVTTAHHLHGISLTRPSCPFTLATPALPEPARSNCWTFNRRVIQFAEDHPEISTVFVSASRGKVVPTPGGDAGEEQIRGYAAAWDALPATVTRVMVLRDPFYDNPRTPDCIDRAVRRRRDPGRVCALRRASSLKPDPAVIAARLRPHRAGLRVDAVDFTRFFCGARRCFPVVGHALVHKDIGHITQTFATTLGPYLDQVFSNTSRK
jgi:hypothetical protein